MGKDYNGNSGSGLPTKLGQQLPIWVTCGRGGEVKQKEIHPLSPRPASLWWGGASFICAEMIIMMFLIRHWWSYSDTPRTSIWGQVDWKQAPLCWKRLSFPLSCQSAWTLLSSTIWIAHANLSTTQTWGSAYGSWDLLKAYARHTGNRLTEGRLYFTPLTIIIRVFPCSTAAPIRIKTHSYSLALT